MAFRTYGHVSKSGTCAAPTFCPRHTCPGIGCRSSKPSTTARCKTGLAAAPGPPPSEEKPTTVKKAGCVREMTSQFQRPSELHQAEFEVILPGGRSKKPKPFFCILQG